MIEAECLQGETEGLDIVEVFEEFPPVWCREKASSVTLAKRNQTPKGQDLVWRPNYGIPLLLVEPTIAYYIGLQFKHDSMTQNH